MTSARKGIDQMSTEELVYLVEVTGILRLATPLVHRCHGCGGWLFRENPCTTCQLLAADHGRTP